MNCGACTKRQYSLPKKFGVAVGLQVYCKDCLRVLATRRWTKLSLLLAVQVGVAVSALWAIASMNYWFAFIGAMVVLCAAFAITVIVPVFPDSENHY